MPELLDLLRLSADLHVAANEPARWPRTWAALCEWFDCPGIYGAVALPPVGDSAWPERLAGFCDRATLCGQSESTPCSRRPGAGPFMRAACQATVEHVSLALAGRRLLMPPHSMAALDALPAPMLLCHCDRKLVFANKAAQRELERARWLSNSDGMVSIPEATQHRRFDEACARLAAAEAGEEAWLAGEPLVGETADLALRRLAGRHGESSEALILVSLVIHAQVPHAEQLARLGERRRLPPRQRELAGHLLAGLSLDDAAAYMGISRRTARDHLKGLFRATGASRQTELIARLSRESLG